MPAPAHQASAVFSPCGEHRLRLDRWWSDEPRALVGMCNPSDAGVEKNDPTVCRLFDLLANRPGIGGFTVVNWETKVTSSPDEMIAWRNRQISIDWEAHAAHVEQNLALMRELTAAAPVRIVAWGNLVPRSDRQTTRVLRALSLDGHFDLHAFAVTPQGNPKHPMARGGHRIMSGQPLELWRPAEGRAG
ncbi:MAG: DUF1643 domain-containing protein [Methylobacterium sp.]|uniref:DUF1643 domain-containing protein n=1 Tax=Methylobacterium sp. TaxID=409 RepID=UPI0025CC9455|nr:DUF1643 domain-containing protein [Methylobacterium sp.]MBX9934422.1 DUF1643 domain-containing protein [Methylobacterium sp.]